MSRSSASTTHLPPISRPESSADIHQDSRLTLATLAAPPTHQIASETHHYLLLQMVATLRLSSSVAKQRKTKQEKEMIAEGLLPASMATPMNASLGSDGSRTTTGGQDDEQDIKMRLDDLGFRIGGDLAERSVLSFRTIRLASGRRSGHDIVHVMPRPICRDHRRSS